MCFIHLNLNSLLAAANEMHYLEKQTNTIDTDLSETRIDVAALAS